MFDRIEFILGEAWTALRRNPFMVFAGITTAAVSLLLIGGVVYVYYQANRFMQSLPSQFEMRAFVQDSVGSKGLTDLQAKLQALPGVQSVTLISKDQAWQKMKSQYPDITFNIQNPLPDAFNVKITNIQAADGVYAALGKTPGIEKVLYQADVLKLIRQGLALLQYLVYLGILFLITGAIVIYNAIRLTIDARRTEIGIMRLVGAPYAVIRVPFILEGMVQGAAGGAVAALVLFLINAALGHYIGRMGLSLPAYPAGSIWLALTIAGTLLGALFSAMAIQKPLKAY